MSAQQTLERRIDAVSDLFDFTARFFEGHAAAAELLPKVDLVLEELFTNVVKYGGGKAAVRVEMAQIAGGVEVIFTDPDADDFDPTRGPEVDLTRPLEQRQPGGLGLHLIKQLVDSIDYRYSAQTRLSRIGFCIRTRPSPAPPPAAAGGTATGDSHAGD